MCKGTERELRGNRNQMQKCRNNEAREKQDIEYFARDGKLAKAR
jgi:hypothetical protein